MAAIGEVEARGTIALVFEGAVPDLHVTMEKQGAARASKVCESDRRRSA